MKQTSNSVDNTSPVIQSLNNKILERTKLPKGWDDIRGEPVAVETAEFAIGILQKIVNPNSLLPSIGAGSGGSIFLQWTKNEYEVEIEIDGLNRVHASRLNLRIDSKEYFEDVKKYNLLTDWIDELTTHSNKKV